MTNEAQEFLARAARLQLVSAKGRKLDGHINLERTVGECDFGTEIAIHNAVRAARHRTIATKWRPVIRQHGRLVDYTSATYDLEDIGLDTAAQIKYLEAAMRPMSQWSPEDYQFQGILRRGRDRLRLLT